MQHDGQYDTEDILWNVAAIRRQKSTTQCSSSHYSIRVSLLLSDLQIAMQES